jgi:D-alanyl-D-alanine carboxypeptidase (penicillin-binding protein 5/6)
MKFRSLLITTAVCGFTCLTGCTTPTGSTQGGSGVPETGPVYPGIGSYVVMDAHDQHVVLAHAANQRRPIASLTKIATAVVVLDFLRNAGLDAGDMMTVPQQVQLLGGPGSAGLQPGDRISVRDGLYAAMIASDNYAAETLAAHVGQKMVAQGVGSNPMAAFLGQMNALASKLGLRDTRFANAHGLDLQRGYSSAADMARLTIHALSVPGFSFYCSQPGRRLTIVRNGQSQGVSITTTNELLFKGGIDGVKTGTTNLAGQCLILSAPKPSTVVKLPDNSTIVTQHRLILVELGATDRFNQAWQLLNDGWTAYFQWRAAGSAAPGTQPSAAPAR